MIRCLALLLILALPARAERQMVAAAHPLAAAAGLEMLRAGGSAVDAAVAVQAVLTLVEPAASGIGGGALALHWDAARHRLSAWDGRETAPAAADPELFLRNGQPLPFYEAVVGGRAVGVPGTLRMLEALHRRHGRLPWARLFAPAIALAEAGFPVSARLAREIGANRDKLARDPAAAAYFLPGGEPLAPGARLRNPALAATLRAVAGHGADALHQGPVAAAILAAVRGHPTNPGLMSAEDLAGYQARERAALCTPYRAYVVCGFPPPSSGGVAVGQFLGILAGQQIEPLDPRGLEAAALIGEAGRLAFADRNRWLADPDHIAVPVAGLLDPRYLAGRAALLRPAAPLPEVRPGQPPAAPAPLASQPPQPEHGTSHVSIVDAAGDAVSMTTTIEDAFGARIMAAGFLLNNELTDFSFVPERGGEPVANRVGPGKRPRSSMSPSIVFQAGEPVAVLGSAGGARIIGHVAQAMLALLDWNLPPRAVVALPHVGALDNHVELEADTSAAALAEPLTQRGFTVRVRSNSSSLQVLRRGPAGWEGAADPRREGVALGD